ncbi:MAG: bifunctional demethylmenaquinone methyltransferase/2-methoxy-6-polyprenyl-1,4-benzoquinol methylase UbiE [Holosporales bacterium]
MTQETHFGFKKVSESDKARLVSDVFRSVASKYDLMNDLMSGGLHRLWKDELIKMLRPRANMHLLDLAGGTGDIARRFLDATHGMTPEAKVTICDINAAMLSEGRTNLTNKGYLKRIDFIQGDATCLPFEDQSFDAVTISFGLRNVANFERALAEIYRVLKVGGSFYCLEFSKINNPLLRTAYQTYAFSVIPTVGQIVAKDRESYQYLIESIEQFPDQATLAAMMQAVGFREVAWRDLTFGVCAIHSGLRLA